jgi:hypothetical protein
MISLPWTDLCGSFVYRKENPEILDAYGDFLLRPQNFRHGRFQWVSDQHSNSATTIQAQIKSSTIQKVALQILTPLAQDAHLETKRSYEGKASRSEWSEATPSGTSDDSAPPLLSGFRSGQHRRPFALEWDATGHSQEFLNIYPRARATSNSTST